MITGPQRIAIIGSALLALFLGALDALVMTAAMPTIVAELGGLHLYSWVYSAYFLSRAVSLPIFGKLADLYKNRNLFITAIGIFVLASVAAGCAPDMGVLIAARVVQGVGAGGVFALVYIVLADISAPEDRGRTLSFASFIWGIASVLGPTLGGFIVSYFSWRWIFFVNVPLGIASLWGIATYLIEFREKRKTVSLDFLGVATLSTAILAFLFAFLVGGRTFPWASLQIVGLFVLSISAACVFIWVERRAADPLLSIVFFKDRGFSTGNGAVFLSSFAIFSLFAFAPLFIQGAQGKTPMEVGLGMLSLSLGWSVGSLALGQTIHRIGKKTAAVLGAMCLIAGSGMTLAFSVSSSAYYCFFVFFVVGVGMGFVTLSTLLVVQSCLGEKDLGVATSSHQFSRTLGGTVGVGVCGSYISTRFSDLADVIRNSDIQTDLKAEMAETGFGRIESLLQPEIQSLLPPDLQHMVQQTVYSGVTGVFYTVSIAAVFCLFFCLLLPEEDRAA